MRCIIFRVFAAALMGLIPLTQSGCLIAAAAAGTGAAVAYVRGDLETTLPGSPENVTAAARQAAEEMHLAVVSCNATALDGQVIARSAADRKITVTVRSEGERYSKVSIRVGAFGDEGISQQVLDKMKTRLAAVPATQPVAGI